MAQLIPDLAKAIKKTEDVYDWSGDKNHQSKVLVQILNNQIIIMKSMESLILKNERNN